METKNFDVELVIDDLCYSDYYSGHGHIFEKDNLVGCIRFDIPVTFSETCKEIAEMLKEEIIGNWYLDIIPEEREQELTEKIYDELSEEVISELVKSAFTVDITSNQKIWIHEEEITDPEADLPLIIGYIHIYEK